MFNNSVYNSLFETENSSYALNELSPIDSFLNAINTPEALNMKNAISTLDVDSKFIYKTNNFLNPYCYYNPGTYTMVDIPALDYNLIVYLKLKERINSYEMHMQKCLKDGNYIDLFSVMNSRITFISLLDLIEKNLIKDSDIYDIFSYVYSEGEYRFDILIDNDIVLDKIRETTPKHILQTIDKIADSNGYITIYRGEESKSTSFRDGAISWTHNLQTAAFFSSRYTCDGKVYIGKVKKENIITYISNREEEILVYSDFIEDIKVFNKLTLEEVFTSCFEEEVLRIKDTINDLACTNSSYHGDIHSCRVLILTLTLSSLENLSVKDKDILSYSAIYHDIGRTSENEDVLHGRYSLDFLPKLPLEDEDLEILRFVIQYHCINDEESKTTLYNKSNIKDKDRAFRLYSIFKDADALDRVRLGIGQDSLDVKYLRNKSSFYCVPLANHLYKYHRMYRQEFYGQNTLELALTSYYIYN